jgi:serine/threonine protein kinase/tetratricopeptide (TPR) repeat protein
MTEQDIYVEAMNRQDTAERGRFLDEACGQNRELRARLEKLVQHSDRVGDFLEQPPAALTMTAEAAVDSIEIGTQIGPYRICDPIGEGGFGVVFMAEQERPVRRKVALKVIKPGMDTRQVIGRFEAERQALAMMDHPNIAKVFDAGATENGRSYFVMELVQGVPITEYCDQCNLTTRERLELFITVCHAVQHAHQKGVIHRDIKPTNVLVAMQDGHATPKIIDFGVAKAIDQRLTEHTLTTAFAQMVGSPLYMSPEQAELSPLGVDTRSDIYSLGVLLYELLTGTTPFDKDRLHSASYDELRRIIREEEPPRPSARLSSLFGSLPLGGRVGEGVSAAETAALATTIAERRRTDPRRLQQSIRGELDWIVMKCLEKDRNRRYETASSLARDAERYLADEPVEACPPSKWYRFRKFARRNKPALLTAALVSSSLIVGIAASTWQAIRASRAEAESIARAEVARQREVETQAVLNFVEDKIFAAARPYGNEGGLGREVTLQRAIDAALPYVESSFTGQPTIEARLRSTLGTSYRYLDRPDIAAEQEQKAHMLFAEHLGTDDPATLGSLNNLALSYRALGRRTEARQLHEETLARQKAKLGPDHPDTLASMNNLANCLESLGEHSSALKLYEETLSLRKVVLGANHPDTLRSMRNLAKSYHTVGRHADALALREQIAALAQAGLGAGHPDTFLSKLALESSYNELGQYEKALKLSEEMHPLLNTKFGQDHPYTLENMDNQANSYTALGRYLEAVELHEETLALTKSTRGPDHPSTLASMNNLAYSYANLGRHDDARKLFQEAFTIMESKLGANHLNTLAAMHNLANSYAEIGQHDRALKLREEALARHRSAFGHEHPYTLASMSNLADSYAQVGRYADARTLNEEALALGEAKLGPTHPVVLITRNRLAWHLVTSPHFLPTDAARAIELTKTSLKLAPNDGDYWNTLGVASYRAGDWNAAVTALEKSIELRQGGDSADFFFLAMAHWQLNEKEIARNWYKQAAEWMEKNKPTDAALHRIHAEAAQLLGVIEPQLATDSQQADVNPPNNSTVPPTEP